MDTTLTTPLSPPAPAPSGESSIGALLLEAGKITPEHAERVLRMQKELGIRFGEAAMRLGLVNEADIEQVLARQFDYPYLQGGAGKFSERLVAAYQPFSPQVEALRAVRSQLMLRWFARGHKSLVVVGVDRDADASLFTANLAVVFSQLGEQTLLVDGNMRQPCQHDIFNLQGRQGLSDMLAARADLDAIARIDSFVDLSVLGAGTVPPNPQELLARPLFGELNTRLCQRYDVVLYDAPAYALGSDALALGMRTGGALVVARKHHSRLDSINALGQQLRSSGVQVVGSVLAEF